MTDKPSPMTAYLVRVFEKPHWRTVLINEDMARAALREAKTRVMA